MRRRYFFAEQKHQRHRARFRILLVLLFLILYVSFTSIFFSMRVLKNSTMEPNLNAGERFVFSSYSFYSFIPGLDLDKGPIPLRRGNVVLVEMFKDGKDGILYSIMDGFLRFFTLQHFSLIDSEENLFVKRLIGLPGDEIIMTNFVIRVKVKGSAYNLTEFEVTERDYTPNIPNVPALWDSSLPFSGNMEKIVLGENECFVLSDDRGNTNDSRTWGPVPIKNIIGKAMFRYWPFSRLGRL
jgi:signal peptidase I